jgi:hypothetical protein
VDGNCFGFDIDGYDKSYQVVIDPYLDYSTFLGGSDLERTDGTCGHDSYGNVIIGGDTTSMNFPTTQGAIDRTRGKEKQDIFISKLSADLGSLIYSTYIGGDYIDTLSHLAIDGNDSIYVTGQTYSLDFPTTDGAFDRTGQCEEPPHSITLGDLFVSKLSPNGSAMEYSTFLGGNDLETGSLLEVDELGCAYVVGSTRSSDFPVKNAYRSDNNEFNCLVFLTKIAPSGSSLIYSTYFGGGPSSLGEWPVAFEVDDHLRPVIAGVTRSNDFPITAKAYSTIFSGNQMAFLTRFSSNGSDLEISTFLLGDIIPYGLSIGDEGYYMTGLIWSGTLPTHESASDQSFQGAYDGFILLLSLNGTTVPYATYVGGHGLDWTNDLSLEGDDDIWVTGYTESGNFSSTKDAKVYPYRGKGDGLILRISKDLSSIRKCWYLGGTEWDEIMGHLIMNGTRIFVIGSTSSNDFPISEGAFDKELEMNMNGAPDVFVSMFSLTSDPPSAPVDLSVSWGDRYLNLSWADPLSDGNHTVLGYVVYRNSSFGMTEIGEIRSRDRWFNDNGLINGVVYDYSVSAFNIVGEGELTENISGMPASIPSAPRGFTGKFGDHETILDWDPPEDDGGFSNYTYNLYYGTITGKMFLLWSGSNVTRYRHTGLTNGHQAYYCVRAVNWVGEGPPSQTIQLYPMGRPSRPLDLVTSVGDGFISIVWLPPKDLGGDLMVLYNLYWSKGGQPFEVIERELYGTNYLLSDLMNGMPIHFAVSANNSQGEGPLTNPVIAVPIGLPSAPRDLTLRSDDESFRISWEPPEDTGGDNEIDYLVYVGDQHQEVLLSKKAQNMTDLVIYEVRNGFQYSVWVTAWNSMGEGPRSGVKKVVPYGKPSSPMNLTGTYQSGSITLEWDQPDDLGGFGSASYEVYLGISRDRLRFTCESEENTVTIGNLTNGVRYFVQVRAENPVGKGLFSNLFSITPLGPPEAPILWQAKEGNSSIELAWIEPVILGGSVDLTYSIYLWHGQLKPTMPYVKDVIGKEYILDGLMNGVEYNVAVSGVTTGGEGAISNVLTAIPLTLPGRPSNCEAVQKGGAVHVGWSPPFDNGGGNITNYIVYRSTDGGGMVKLASLGSSSYEFIDEKIVKGSVYIYAISARNRVGEGDRSLPMRINARSIDEGEGPDRGWISISIVIVSVMVISLLIFMVLRNRRRRAGERT